MGALMKPDYVITSEWWALLLTAMAVSMIGTVLFGAF
jgi:hypothetical protein